MLGLIFIDSFFVCVACFPCYTMPMLFSHVPKVPLPVYITPQEIIINYFKTNTLFCNPLSLVKNRTKRVFFLQALYQCSKLISHTLGNISLHTYIHTHHRHVHSTHIPQYIHSLISFFLHAYDIIGIQ